jgi:hypothetical protein
VYDAVNTEHLQKKIYIIMKKMARTREQQEEEPHYLYGWFKKWMKTLNAQESQRLQRELPTDRLFKEWYRQNRNDDFDEWMNEHLQSKIKSWMSAHLLVGYNLETLQWMRDRRISNDFEQWYRQWVEQNTDATDFDRYMAEHTYYERYGPFSDDPFRRTRSRKSEREERERSEREERERRQREREKEVYEVPESKEELESLVTCAICMDKKRTVLVLPCKHLAMCSACARRIYETSKECPICKTPICSLTHVFYRSEMSITPKIVFELLRHIAI